MEPEAFSGDVWRITGRGRDPLQGSSALGRWTQPGEFDVLYTSLERDSALTEIGYSLSLEPVWPSRAEHDLHRIAARTKRTPRFANIESLAPLGVEPSRYSSYGYTHTGHRSRGAVSGVRRVDRPQRPLTRAASGHLPGKRPGRGCPDGAGLRTGRLVSMAESPVASNTRPTPPCHARARPTTAAQPSSGLRPASSASDFPSPKANDKAIPG